MMRLLKDAKRCTGITKSGEPCKAFARSGADFCLSHDAATAEHLAASRRLGGKHRKRYPAPREDSTPLRSVDDALALLERAACDVERLDHGANRVRAMVAIAEAASRIIETLKLSSRLEELEAHLSSTDGAPWSA
jgi:alkylhydroperoxidase family enzyme